MSAPAEVRAPRPPLLKIVVAEEYGCTDSVCPVDAGHRLSAEAAPRVVYCHECARQYTQPSRADERAFWNSTMRCADCGEAGERVGHQTCQYPGRASEARHG